TFPRHPRRLSIMTGQYPRDRWLKNMKDDSCHRLIAISYFPASIGRSSKCAYQIRHLAISRSHCSFDLRDGQIWIRDLGSLNGTYLNSRQITDPQPLRDGDRLAFASFSYEVCLSSAQPAVFQLIPLSSMSASRGAVESGGKGKVRKALDRSVPVIRQTL